MVLRGLMGSMFLIHHFHLPFFNLTIQAIQYKLAERSPGVEYIKHHKHPLKAGFKMLKVN